MKNKLDEAREIINAVDAEMIELFKKRMAASKMVAEYKKDVNMPILDEAREKLLIEKNIKLLKQENIMIYCQILNIYLHIIEKKIARN